MGTLAKANQAHRQAIAEWKQFHDGLNKRMEEFISPLNALYDARYERDRAMLSSDSVVLDYRCEIDLRELPENLKKYYGNIDSSHLSVNWSK